MKSSLLLLLFLTISSFFYGQITIDNTTNSPTQLVDGVLIPTGSGTVITNVQFGGVYMGYGGREQTLAFLRASVADAP